MKVKDLQALLTQCNPEHDVCVFGEQMVTREPVIAETTYPTTGWSVVVIGDADRIERAGLTKHIMKEQTP